MKILFIFSEKYGTKEVLLDDDTFESINCHKWHIRKDHNTFYARRNYWIKKDGVKKCVTVLMHRFILSIEDHKIEVDHIDHNGLNNQKHNIRSCTHKNNMANKKSYIGSSSKYLGVGFKKGKWESRIRANKKYYHIGVFKTENEAAIAYNNKAKELYGEFANLNIL